MSNLNSLVPVFLRRRQLLEVAFLYHVPVRLVTLSISMWLVVFSFYLIRVKTVVALTESWSHSSLVEEVRVVVAEGKL
jgi:hypothetical protein